jgi:hypothetical protein
MVLGFGDQTTEPYVMRESWLQDPPEHVCNSSKSSFVVCPGARNYEVLTIPNCIWTSPGQPDFVYEKCFDRTRFCTNAQFKVPRVFNGRTTPTSADCKKKNTHTLPLEDLLEFSFGGAPVQNWWRLFNCSFLFSNGWWHPPLSTTKSTQIWL